MHYLFLMVTAQCYADDVVKKEKYRASWYFGPFVWIYLVLKYLQC